MANTGKLTINDVRAYAAACALTMLLSAFLLFLIEPMFGKLLLPLLGGAPSVWNTALVFFQALLLAGYGYAHLLARVRRFGIQAAAHVAVLAVCALTLPPSLPAHLVVPTIDYPQVWQLGLMARCIGGPFFALSATAPLLQSWFARSQHPDANDPYFLYAGSNVGSLGALLLYPLAVEPLLTLRQQSWSWSGGYLMFIAAMAGCAALTRKNAIAGFVVEDHAETIPAKKAPVALWLLLAFIPSSLLLSVTSYITTDLASLPLLWLAPIALYVSTFIIAFARRPILSARTVYLCQAVFFAAGLACFLIGGVDFHFTALVCHLLLFFFTALACHMQLAALRPPARKLTFFYFIMSAGGVAGGTFNALLAPFLFVLPIEYALALGVAAFLRFSDDDAQTLRQFLTALRRKFIEYFSGSVLLLLLALSAVFTAGKWQIGACGVIALVLCLLNQRRWAFGSLVAIILFLHPGYDWNWAQHALTVRRNFFGVLRVSDDPKHDVRLFTHGTTLHGAQPLDAAHRMMPISYYARFGPVGDAFGAVEDTNRVAVLGLGVGVVACYAEPGRSFDFYELDPDVARIAQDTSLFTYLSGCGSPYKIILGDARLKIVDAPDHSYDMIFVDTFSSDNIPVHLVTKEALALYFQKLKPGGSIVMNLSNRHLSLEPVIAAEARDLGHTALFKSHRGGVMPGTVIPYTGEIFAVVSDNQAVLDKLLQRRWHTWLTLRPEQQGWRDDFSNIVGAIRWHLPTADE